MSGLLHRIDIYQPDARSATAALDAFLKEMYWDDAFIAQFHVCSPTYAVEGGVFAPDAPWGARLLVCGVEDKNDEKRTLEFLFNGIEDFAMSSRLGLNPAVTFDGSRKRIAFNIACGESTTLNRLFLILRDILSEEDPFIAHLDPNYEPARKLDIPDSQASIRKAVELLNFFPSYKLEIALRIMTRTHSSGVTY